MKFIQSVWFCLLLLSFFVSCYSRSSDNSVLKGPTSESSQSNDSEVDSSTSSTGSGGSTSGSPNSQVVQVVSSLYLRVGDTIKLIQVDDLGSDNYSLVFECNTKQKTVRVTKNTGENAILQNQTVELGTLEGKKLFVYMFKANRTIAGWTIDGKIYFRVILEGWSSWSGEIRGSQYDFMGFLAIGPGRFMSGNIIKNVEKGGLFIINKNSIVLES